MKSRRFTDVARTDWLQVDSEAQLEKERLMQVEKEQLVAQAATLEEEKRVLEGRLRDELTERTRVVQEHETRNSQLEAEKAKSVALQLVTAAEVDVSIAV